MPSTPATMARPRIVSGEALVQVDRVFKRFQSGFLGKVSPVHFFWEAST